MAGSLLDLRITMPDPHLEVDLLPPPTQPVEKIAVECPKGSDVDDLDARAPIWLIQEPRKDGKNGRLSFSIRSRRYQQDVLAFQNRWNRSLLGFSGFKESSFFDSFR